MTDTNESSLKDFPESMVTQALALHLGHKGKENAKEMEWLFGLLAETPKGRHELRHLCEFDWNPSEVEGGPEESFKDADRGNIPADEFRKVYLTLTPDFRYRTKKTGRHLIIEAKATPKPIGQRDRV